MQDAAQIGRHASLSAHLLPNAPRCSSTAAAHPLFVRVAHWVHAIAFLGLLISGAAILLAHPRLYWGETGAYGSPALIELPLPLNLDQSGWGRSLHFLSAWVFVITGTVYAIMGVVKRHFTGAAPAAGRENSALQWSTYTLRQRLAYAAVVFVLAPLMAASGLAMSPAIGAAAPGIVTAFGGHQSARTIHFFLMLLLLGFFLVHVVLALRALLTGDPAPERTGAQS